MLEHGKYFVIRSRLNQLVLDVMEGEARPGADVKTYSYNGGLNQQWCVDAGHGVICSALDERLVLTCSSGGSVKLQHLRPGEVSQQWEIAGTAIVNRKDRRQVLDIANNNRDMCATVVSWQQNSGANQQWSFTYMPPRRCFIVSKMNGKLLDVQANNKSRGTKVIMYERNGGANQMFYEDYTGIIRSCLNDFALHTKDGCLRLNHYQPHDHAMQWRKSGDRIAHAHNRDRVLDIANSNTSNSAEVVDWQENGGANQQWHFEYIN